MREFGGEAGGDDGQMIEEVNGSAVKVCITDARSMRLSLTDRCIPRSRADSHLRATVRTTCIIYSTLSSPFALAEDASDL